MARSATPAAISLEVPAPVCVCGLLAVAALTKGGHPEWAIGGTMFLYALYLAAQYAKWQPSTRAPHSLATSSMVTSSGDGPAGAS